MYVKAQYSILPEVQVVHQIQSLPLLRLLVTCTALMSLSKESLKLVHLASGQSVSSWKDSK